MFVTRIKARSNMLRFRYACLDGRDALKLVSF